MTCVTCILSFTCSKIHIKIDSFQIFHVPFQAEEEMNHAKIVYEFINNELKEELPVLYDRSD